MESIKPIVCLGKQIIIIEIEDQQFSMQPQ